MEHRPCLSIWPARERIAIVLTTSLVNQYEDVLHRPEHRMEGWTDADLFALVDSLLVPARWVMSDFSHRPSLRDAGDELVLEAARRHLVLGSGCLSQARC